MSLLPGLAGFTIRGIDKWGSGAFLASRGGRPHWGADVALAPGFLFPMPCHGIVSRIARPYADDPLYGGYLIRADWGATVRAFYVEAAREVAGKYLLAGAPLGAVQSLQGRYPGIIDHVHVEVRPPNGWPFPISWVRGRDYELCETGSLPGWRVNPALLI